MQSQRSVVFSWETESWPNGRWLGQEGGPGKISCSPCARRAFTRELGVGSDAKTGHGAGQKVRDFLLLNLIYWGNIG